MTEPTLQTKYTAEQLIARYVQLRDDKSALAERQAAEMKPYNDALQVIETALQDALNNCGGDSIKTKAGTAYKSTATTCKVEDWPRFITYVQETGDVELLVRNVNKTRFEELLNNSVLVPGVSTASVQRINVRRA